MSQKTLREILMHYMGEVQRGTGVVLPDHNPKMEADILAWHRAALEAFRTRAAKHVAELIADGNAHEVVEEISRLPIEEGEAT